MPSKQPSTASSKIVCLCGAVSLAGSFIKDGTFPIASGICHCNLCRKVTGALCSAAIALKDIPEVLLQPFQTYKATDNITSYFCKTCGSKVLVNDKRLGWYATAANIDRSDEQRDKVDTIELKWSMQSDDTIDGGYLKRMAEVAHAGMKDLKCYSEGFSGEPVALVDVERLWFSNTERKTGNGDQSTSGSDASVPLSCHCGGISLRVLPATRRNPSTIAEGRTRENGTKYLARICCCRSCRLPFGAPITPWCYIFPECILTPDSEPVPFDFQGDYSKISSLRTLRTYPSSPATRKSFCGKCGATVFSEHQDRMCIINVAPGLLNAASGSLASEILSWDWTGVSWPEHIECKAWLDSITGGTVSPDDYDL